MLIEPATRKPVTLRLALVLCSLFFGTAITEATSVYLLPLSIEGFTQNPLVIALILAINPIFGFIAQPLVGIWSDRIWTRFGRRAFFLIMCSPIAAVALLLIPFAAFLWQLILLVVILQFFEDMLYGADQPLLADLVPPERRTFILGLIKAFDNLAFLFVLYVGMQWVYDHAQTNDSHYGLPMYIAAAAAQIGFVFIAAFFLQEERRELPEKRKLSIRQYVSDFVKQPMLFRIASAYFIRAFTRTAVVGYVALYAVQSLQFTEDQLGASWGLMPFVALVLGIPLGLGVEKFAKNRVLQAGFLTVIIGCVIGYHAETPFVLAVAALIFGFGDIVLEVTHKAFLSDHYPVHMIGQLTGAVNIFYASGRTAALILVGTIVHWMNPNDISHSPGDVVLVDYHSIWIICAVSAAIGVAILSTVRDFRHESRMKSHEITV